MTVTLTWYERLVATTIGLLRQTMSELRGTDRPLCSGEPSDENNIHSAGAEMAVAKFLSRYWLAGVNTFKDPDVAPNIEVRRNTYPEGQSLLKVKPTDPDERRYVMVRGEMPTYEIVGWLWGHEAKRPEWLQNPHDYGEVYYVPESKLHREFKLANVAVKAGEA
jgi:hypothetical protein